MKNLKQKIIGVVMLILGALTVPVANDATGFIFVCFFAIPCIFSKDKMLY